MENNAVSEQDDGHIKHQVRHLSMAVCIEGIITELVSVWLVMCVGLVNNQVGVCVWRENVLVTKAITKM